VVVYIYYFEYQRTINAKSVTRKMCDITMYSRCNISYTIHCIQGNIDWKQSYVIAWVSLERVSDTYERTDGFTNS